MAAVSNTSIDVSGPPQMEPLNTEYVNEGYYQSHTSQPYFITTKDIAYNGKIIPKGTPGVVQKSKMADKTKHCCILAAPHNVGEYFTFGSDDLSWNKATVKKAIRVLMYKQETIGFNCILIKQNKKDDAKKYWANINRINSIQQLNTEPPAKKRNTRQIPVINFNDNVLFNSQNNNNNNHMDDFDLGNFVDINTNNNTNNMDIIDLDPDNNDIDANQDDITDISDIKDNDKDIDKDIDINNKNNNKNNNIVKSRTKIKLTQIERQNLLRMVMGRDILNKDPNKRANIFKKILAELQYLDDYWKNITTKDITAYVYEAQRNLIRLYKEKKVDNVPASDTTFLFYIESCGLLAEAQLVQLKANDNTKLIKQKRINIRDRTKAMADDLQRKKDDSKQLKQQKDKNQSDFFKAGVGRYGAATAHTRMKINDNVAKMRGHCISVLAVVWGGAVDKKDKKIGRWTLTDCIKEISQINTPNHYLYNDLSTVFHGISPGSSFEQCAIFIKLLQKVQNNNNNI